MKLKFKLVSEDLVQIISVENGIEREVGEIFTPSTGNNEKNELINTIQVCGFSEAFDLWGCGIYQIKGKQVKDIQLIFSADTEKNSAYNVAHRDCIKCYNEPCTCEEKEGLPYRVKSKMEVIAERL